MATACCYNKDWVEVWLQSMRSFVCVPPSSPLAVARSLRQPSLRSPPASRLRPLLSAALAQAIAVTCALQQQDGTLAAVARSRFPPFSCPPSPPRAHHAASVPRMLPALRASSDRPHKQCSCVIMQRFARAAATTLRSISSRERVLRVPVRRCSAAAPAAAALKGA